MNAGVNMALMDLVARSSGVPLFQYLGGPTRHKVRVMAVLDGEQEAGLGQGIELTWI